MPTPQLVQGEPAITALKRGFDQIADLLAITLGPTQGTILAKHETKTAPEIISDAATIARRLFAIPERTEDVGAMLARNLVWRQHIRAGDGCATAAVLAQAILNEGSRLVAAGHNPMVLRRGIDHAARVAMDALRAMARPAQAAELTHLAETITGDEKLSAVLAEIFSTLGADAYVSIEEYLAPYIERQYAEGGRWNGKLVSPYLITDSARRRAIIEECHIVLYDGPVQSVQAVQRMLEIVAGTQWHQVALIATAISGLALTTLVLNQQQGKIKIIAAELRERESKRQNDFADLAALTGATILSPERGRALEQLEPTDLGASPRVEADANELILVGGEGDQAAIENQVALIRARIASLPETDDASAELRFRLARLQGQIAKLLIGAHTEAERNVIRQKAEKAIRALPLALREGVVAGGGVAYLNCVPAVRALDGEQKIAGEIVARALQAPMHQLLSNAGIDAPAALIARAQQRGADFGCDVLSGDIVAMNDAGILDSVSVLREAVQTAVSGAMMALTTDTIVLHKNPQTVYEP